MSSQSSQTTNERNSNLPRWAHYLPFLSGWRNRLGVSVGAFFLSVGLTPFDSLKKPFRFPGQIASGTVFTVYGGKTAERGESVVPEERHVPGAVGRIARAAQWGKIHFLKSGIAENEGLAPYEQFFIKADDSLGEVCLSLRTSPPSS